MGYNCRLLEKVSGSSYQYEELVEYEFEVMPQAGDTIALGEGRRDVWVVVRKHWMVSGEMVLVVRRGVQ